jgi:hypothetical protein
MMALPWEERWELLSSEAFPAGFFHPHNLCKSCKKYGSVRDYL